MKSIINSLMIGVLAMRFTKGRALRRASEGLFMGLLTFGILAGCSSHSERTVEREKTVRYDSVANSEESEPVVTERTTTKTEESTKNDDSGGLLSGTVDVVGEALALPFRLVGGLIRAVF
ncbi:MAG: hypothetical protein ACM3SP_16575 [Chloroflexota bacterium]|jgi:hypothetical protein